MTGAADVRRAAGYTERTSTLDVRCRHCGSAVGEDCHGLTPKTRNQRRAPHPIRVDDAAEPHAQVIPFRRHLPPGGPSG